MTIYRAQVLDTPDDPFTGGTLRTDSDAGLRVVDGVITTRGPFAEVWPAYAGEDVVDLRRGILLPGLVDTHVHYPQVRTIGALGMPLLDWLEMSALPEEAKLASPAYAREVAQEFMDALICAGTTSALVFGSHFAAAMDALFAEAGALGVRMTAGLVVSDRLLPQELLTTPNRSYEEAHGLIERWHGVGRLRYAVTPRFSYSAGDDLLGRVCSGAQGRSRRLVHLPRQREPGRGRRGRRAVRGRGTLRGHVRPA